MDWQSRIALTVVAVDLHLIFKIFLMFSNVIIMKMKFEFVWEVLITLDCPVRPYAPEALSYHQNCLQCPIQRWY